MSTPGRAPLRAVANRRAPRCPLAVPVRVTVLRSGAAYSIPGRSLDLGEGGISAVLAGEVQLADAVGVEFLLPDLGLGLHAKAVVRHYAPLRCGFEFQGLTRHQQAVIREWARQRLQPAVGTTPATGPKVAAPVAKASLVKRVQKLDRVQVRRFLWTTAAALLLAGLLAWWHWQREWKELEEPISRPAGQTSLIVTDVLRIAG
jgi:hypothetical protein